MPHIIVKLWPGKSEEQKLQLTRAIVKDVMDTIQCPEEAVSVAFEEIKSEEWEEKVLKPDILDGPGKLYKRPGPAR